MAKKELVTTGLDVSAILMQARAIVPEPKAHSKYILTVAEHPFVFRRRAAAVGFAAGLLTAGKQVDKAERVDA